MFFGGGGGGGGGVIHAIIATYPVGSTCALLTCTYMYITYDVHVHWVDYSEDMIHSIFHIPGILLNPISPHTHSSWHI